MKNKKLIKEFDAVEWAALVKKFKSQNVCYDPKSKSCRQCRDSWLNQQAKNLFSIDGPAILSF